METSYHEDNPEIPLMAVLPSIDEDETAKIIRHETFKPTLAFWLIFLVLGFVALLSALEASAIAIALPRIVTDLHGEEVFIWYITGYLITASVFMPM